jgi:hypothetical protein
LAAALRSISAKVANQFARPKKRTSERHQPPVSGQGPSLAGIKQDNGEWCSRISVVDAAGRVIADDARSWLAQSREAEIDDLIARINESDLRLHRSQGNILYALGVDPRTPLDFVQIAIRVVVEATCSLRGIDRWTLRKNARRVRLAGR